MLQLKFLIVLLFFVVAQGGQLRFHKADDLQLADFHLITKQRIKEADVYEADQKVVKEWRECFKICLDLSNECRSFNFLFLAANMYKCQPSKIMAHLQNDKIQNTGVTTDQIWYMPYANGTKVL